MARVVKNEDEWHLITIEGDQGGGGKAILVSGKSRAYLSVYADIKHLGLALHRYAHMSISGPATLRRLAYAILRDVPAPKKRKRKGGSNA